LRRAAGDSGSDATEEERRGRWQCRTEARTWTLPDAVRATKKSSTSVVSGTTTEKGAADKNKATTNRNLDLKGKKAMLCAQVRHTLTRCGIHFRSTQTVQRYGKPQALDQLEEWMKENPIPYISNDKFSQEGIFDYWDVRLSGHAHVNQTYCQGTIMSTKRR
jgi:hypothetical protein